MFLGGRAEEPLFSLMRTSCLGVSVSADVGTTTSQSCSRSHSLRAQQSLLSNNKNTRPNILCCHITLGARPQILNLNLSFARCFRLPPPPRVPEMCPRCFSFFVSILNQEKHGGLASHAGPSLTGPRFLKIRASNEYGEFDKVYHARAGRKLELTPVAGFDG